MFTRILLIFMLFGVGSPATLILAQGSDTPEARYQQALRDYRNKSYKAALRKFKDACKADADYRDACLYWMASSSYKLGNIGQAQDYLAEYFEFHSQSSWTEDARALEAEILAETGVAFEGDDLEDLSPATAMMFLSHLETEEALELIEKILNQKGASRYREQALFALTQHDHPKAREVLQKYAVGDDGVLGRLAIQYLGLSGNDENLDFLRARFNNEKNRKKREELLSAFMVANDFETLSQIATSVEDDQLAKSAIMLIGAMGKNNILSELYEQTTSQPRKLALVQGIGLSQDVSLLKAIYAAESDQELRETTIVQLGIAGACGPLEEIYQTEEDVAIRMKCIDAFLIANSCDGLLNIAQTETNPDLVHKAILTMGASGRNYRDELVEMYDATEVSKEKSAVIQALFLKQADEPLIEIAKNETQKELRLQAVQVLGLINTEKAKTYLKSLLDL